MATKSKPPKGFNPAGNGPAGQRYGRDPETGLAYKSDGTTRAKRRTFSAGEVLNRLQDAARAAMASIGRSAARNLPALDGFRGTIGTFRKWTRDAKAYSTPESRAERARYYRAMLDTVEAKGAAAEAWLPGAQDAISAIDGLYEKVGQAIADHQTKTGAMPNDKEMEAIFNRHLTPSVRNIVEGAADPANDPFASFRKDAAEPDTGTDEDEDEDEDTDED